MKKFILTFIAIASFTTMLNAQADNFAELNNTTLYMKNGTVLREGDVIVLGKATGCYENCFEYIFQEPTEMLPKLTNKFTKNVYAIRSGERVSIKKIKQISQNKEKIWLLVLNYAVRKENFYCYLEQAFTAGEIILPAASVNTSQPTIQQEVKPVEQVIKSEIKQEEPKTTEQPVKIQQPDVKEKQNFSVADEIRKLKALLDEGIITNEEFEKLKAKLLE
jgi:hypothetical protein